LTFLITFLHLWILKKLSPHIILEELYYIPILLGALFFGLKGAILTYIFVSLSYVPFFFGLWTVTPLGVANRVLHLLFSGLLAFLAGFLVERMKAQQKELEKDRHLSRIGRVASAVVHDLKNPLITIQGFSRRILNGKGNIETAAQAISESAQTMQKIVNDVLDFSKPAALELKEADIGDIVKQASDMCTAKAEAKGIILSMDSPEKPIIIPVERFQIHRALVNLISNAIESSGKGQRVFINLTTRKNRLLIKIKDNGTGIDEETLENIFVPFYSRKPGGTGLGMPIAKKIVDGHEGKIHINSKQGAGSEVIIELPSKSDKKRIM
jgi:signal transduction histidine kinase